MYDCFCLLLLFKLCGAVKAAWEKEDLHAEQLMKVFIEQPWPDFAQV